MARHQRLTYCIVNFQLRALQQPMLYFSTILARNASSILSHLSRLPTELSTHPLLFTLSTNAPTASLTPLVTALSSLSTSSGVGCLSAPSHLSAPIACSVAFFHKEDATPFWSDIPGRPETQVGRWHAMRKKGDEERSWGGSELALLEEENVDWESVWNRSVAGNALPASLRKLRCVSIPTIPLRSLRGFGSERRTCIRSSL